MRVKALPPAPSLRAPTNWLHPLGEAPAQGRGRLTCLVLGVFLPLAHVFSNSSQLILT